MAGAWIVIYIPCFDSAEDSSNPEGKSEARRKVKGPSASTTEDEKEKEEKDQAPEDETATEDTPLVDHVDGLVNSDSGIVSVSQ